MTYPDPGLRERAQLLLQDEHDMVELTSGSFEKQIDALTAEFDAAIADRWIEWQEARKAGWPLDRPLNEREGS